MSDGLRGPMERAHAPCDTTPRKKISPSKLPSCSPIWLRRAPVRRLIAYPGAGTNVPVWLLGSTTYSAQLAAALGLPFAFASHFAPALLMEAIEVYRDEFRPSVYRKEPYVMAGVPLVAAEDDAGARRLATSAFQRHLRLIRHEPIFVPPPVESMDGLWSEAEKFMVESRMAVAVIGGPGTVRHKLAQLLRETKARRTDLHFAICTIIPCDCSRSRLRRTP